jgi:hypothetical protein
MNNLLKKPDLSVTIEGRPPEVPDVRRLSREEMSRLERQLIPLLNTLRMLQGKRAIVVPGEKRAHG